jgi:hypothetical protein
MYSYLPGIYHASGIVHENIQLLILFTELLRTRQAKFFHFPLRICNLVPRKYIPYTNSNNTSVADPKHFGVDPDSGIHASD